LPVVVDLEQVIVTHQVVEAVVVQDRLAKMVELITQTKEQLDLVVLLVTHLQEVDPQVVLVEAAAVTAVELDRVVVQLAVVEDTKLLTVQ
jgi:Zn-dependent oligopeptidase